MIYNPLDPMQADIMVNLPALARKVSDPFMGIGSGNSSLMCYTTGNGTNKCFEYKGKNDVACKGNRCFVAFQTRNQRVAGNGPRLRNLGLDILMLPDGLATSYIVVGNVEKNRFRTLKKIIGDFEPRVVKELPILHKGMPSPPGKCHLNPFGKDCLMYLSSDDW
jgi:hypothetical protein